MNIKKADLRVFETAGSAPATLWVRAKSKVPWYMPQGSAACYSIVHSYVTYAHAQINSLHIDIELYYILFQYNIYMCVYKYNNDILRKNSMCVQKYPPYCERKYIWKDPRKATNVITKWRNCINFVPVHSAKAPSTSQVVASQPGGCRLDQLTLHESGPPSPDL